MVVLGCAAYFPYVTIYDVVLTKMVEASEDALPLDPNIFRLQVTIASLLIAGVLSVSMVLLRKACRSLELQLFKRILSWGIFYIPIVTILMLTGLWLDFRMGLPLTEEYREDFCRVAYIFAHILAHEIGHALGLKDEKLDPNDDEDPVSYQLMCSELLYGVYESQKFGVSYENSNFMTDISEENRNNDCLINFHKLLGRETTTNLW